MLTFLYTQIINIIIFFKICIGYCLSNDCRFHILGYYFYKLIYYCSLIPMNLLMKTIIIFFVFLYIYIKYTYIYFAPQFN